MEPAHIWIKQFRPLEDLCINLSNEFEFNFIPVTQTLARSKKTDTQVDETQFQFPIRFWLSDYLFLEKFGEVIRAIIHFLNKSFQDSASSILWEINVSSNSSK